MRTIPQQTLDQLEAYLKHRRAPGGFLLAVLRNDLGAAARLADSENGAALVELSALIFQLVPANSYGSEEKVQAWLDPDGEESRPEFVYRPRKPGLDFDLLERQSAMLSSLTDNRRMVPKNKEAIAGVLDMIDDILNQAKAQGFRRKGRKPG